MTAAQHTRIGLITAIVLALAAAGAILKPEHMFVWAAGGATMIAAWLVTAIAARRQSESRHGQLVFSALAAGVMLAIAMAVRLAGELGYTGGGAGRAFGITMGLYLVAVGNALPKIVGPLVTRRCSPAQMQSTQRFAGWAFALAGLMYTGVWLALDTQQANIIATAVCASAMILVIARILWATTRPQLT